MHRLRSSMYSVLNIPSVSLLLPPVWTDMIVEAGYVGLLRVL